MSDTRSPGAGSLPDRSPGGLQERTPHKARRNPPWLPDPKRANQGLASMRMGVEHPIGGWKRFRILSSVFRPMRALYNPVFLAVVGIVNFLMDRRGRKAESVIESALPPQRVERPHNGKNYWAKSLIYFQTCVFFNPGQEKPSSFPIFGRRHQIFSQDQGVILLTFSLSPYIFKIGNEHRVPAGICTGGDRRCGPRSTGGSAGWSGS